MLHALGRACACPPCARWRSTGASPSPGRTARRARPASARCSRPCSPRAGCTCCRGRAPTCWAAATAPRSPTPRPCAASSPPRPAGSAASSASTSRPAAHRQRARPRRHQDGVGPHARRGLPRVADHAADHLERARLDARRAARARPGAPARARARRRDRGVVPELGFFFKDPWGTDVHDFGEQTTELAGVGAGHRRQAAGGGAVRRDRTVSAVTDVLELVRAPAALTVVGDTLAGAAAGGRRFGPRQWLLPVASACLYSGGMALNDYADRAPRRRRASGAAHPVGPGDAASARSASPPRAWRSASGWPRTAGGRRALAVALPLAGCVVAYDLVFKDTAVGPVVMAACRGLDVLLGAAGRLRRRCRPPRRSPPTRSASPCCRAARCTARLDRASPLAGDRRDRGDDDRRGRRRRRPTGQPSPGRSPARPPTPGRRCPASWPPSATRRPRNARTATRAGIGAMVPLQADAGRAHRRARACRHARRRRPPPPPALGAAHGG